MSFYYNQKKKIVGEKNEARGWKVHWIKNLYLERARETDESSKCWSKPHEDLIQSLVPTQKGSGMVWAFNPSDRLCLPVSHTTHTCTHASTRQAHTKKKQTESTTHEEWYQSLISGLQMHMNTHKHLNSCIWRNKISYSCPAPFPQIQNI